MLNGKMISVQSIIAKVYRDLQLKEEEPFADFIEWSSEALEFIHVYPQYTHKEAKVYVKNFKAEIPCDYIALDAVEYNGQAVSYTTNIFGPRDTGFFKGYLTPYSYNQDKINNVLLQKGNIIYGDNSFSIQDGYFTTSFKEGLMHILYTAIPTDEDGYPLIPDHVSFREALYWYVVYKYMYAKVLNGTIQGQFYQDAYSKWQYYCNQAGAEAMMPDLATLENLKRNFIKLKPNMFQFDSFYQNLNNVK